MNKALFWPVALILGILAAIICFALLIRANSPHKLEQVKDRAAREELVKAIEAAYEKAEKLDRELLSAHLEKSRAIIEPLHADAVSRVPNAVETLTGITGCATLLWHSVRDELMGEDEVQAYVSNILASHFTQKTDIGAQSLGEAYASFAQELTQNRQALTGDIERLLGPSAPERLQGELHEHAITFSKEVELISDKFPRIAGSTALGVSEVSLQVFTGDLVRTARNAFNGIVKKYVKQVGRNAALAAVDGPFPAGDILAFVLTLGTTAFGIKDLYDAQIVLKGEAKDQLTTALDRYKAALSSKNEETANDLLEANLEAKRHLKEKAIESIMAGKRAP